MIEGFARALIAGVGFGFGFVVGVVLAVGLGFTLGKVFKRAALDQK